MAEDTRLTGLVAGILNDRELVINIGEQAGVKVGMKFKVLDKEVLVKDPATGEELGTVQREKIRVKVFDVQPKLAMARTYETTQVNIGGIGPDLSIMRGILAPPQWVTRVRTLAYKDSGLDYAPLNEESSFVKVGDPIELVEEAS